MCACAFVMYLLDKIDDLVPSPVDDAMQEVVSEKSGVKQQNVVNIESYCWKKHCRSLFSLPVAI